MRMLTSPHQIARRSLVALVALVVLASACAATPTMVAMQEPTAAELAAAERLATTFEATPEYLARVKARSAQADTVRFEVFTSLESSLFDMGSRVTPSMTGETSGQQSRIFLDLEPMVGPLMRLSGMDSSGLSMTMITEDDVVYLNAPFFASIAQSEGLNTSSGEFGWVDQVATGWGRINFGQIGQSGALGEMGLNLGAGADQMLALIESTDNVFDGGETEVRGVPVRSAFGQVTAADVLTQAGQSLDSFGIPDNQADILREMSAHVSVYIDFEGMIRRVEYTVDFSALTELDPNTAGLDLKMWQRVDFFDYGAAIDIVAPLDAIDITDDFEDLLDELG